MVGTVLPDEVAADHPAIRKAWGDGGYRPPPRHRRGDHRPQPGPRGFTRIPQRWAAERTYGWLMLHRRLARDCETLPTRPEAMIDLAMTGLTAWRSRDGASDGNGP
ncbi:hypothetical protein GCM10010284_66090 [Streptomyces rubiginosohelvolus]|nr:hypothetical protein GCM10010284_66090 [Streptomyces rubiginosohelvolus]